MRKLLINGIETCLGKRLHEIAERQGITPHGIVSTHIRDLLGQISLSRIGEWDFDYVANVAGINHLSKIGRTPPRDAEIFTRNVMSHYNLIDYLVGENHPPARVLNVASQTYRIPQRCTSLYCASKAAIVQMTKVMARELAPSGWVVNAIAPGKMVDTNMARLTDEQVLELRGWTKEQADAYALTNIPMGRFTTTAEVSKAMLAIFELPAYINGSIIDMTGGA